MSNSPQPIRILVLCTGNSCRSILAEVLFNELGHGRVTAASAGSRPAAAVNPAAIAKLRKEGHSAQGLSSKSWNTFGGPDGPAIDIVITVCDSAAGESCPVWSGAPVVAHWGIPDPADADADDRDRAFDLAYSRLRTRIELTLELPLESLDVRYIKDALQRIHDACSHQEYQTIPA